MRKHKPKPHLTILQQRAANAILSGIATNMTEACRIAGYKGNRNTIAQRGKELVRNSTFQAALKAQKDAIAKKTEIEAIKVVSELAKIAFVNSQELYDKDGNLIPIQDLPTDVAAAIQTVKVNSLGHITEVKLHSKLTALQDLCKHLGLFQADRLPAENLEAKRLEAAKSENVLKAIQAVYEDRYGVKQIESQVIEAETTSKQATNSSAASGLDAMFPTETPFLDETPVTPQAGGA